MKKKHLKSILLLLGLLTLTLPVLGQFTVDGSVRDGSGNALIGVTIAVKGTTIGTISDADGKFSLQIPGNSATLEVSFVGFQTLTREVTAADTPLDIVLQEGTTTLDEVVVTGLASSIKRANSGNAVSTVSGEELAGATTVQTLDGALKGKFTGANIVSHSGAPGGGLSVKLRGITTINGSSEPLYIVDGVYMDNSAFSSGTNPVTQARTNGEITDEQDNPANRIADLNPEDIESVEILKGASAAAIYGARANAGVVIITTKRGREGRTRVSLNQSNGFASLVRKLGTRSFTDSIVLNAFDEDELQRYQAAKAAGRLFDYEEELYGNTGFLNNTNVNVSGGNATTRFFVGASYRDEEGIIRRTGFERKSLRLNLDHQFSEIIDFALSANYVNSSADRGVTNNDNAGVSFGIALANTPPWVDLFPDENGFYPDNPLAASNFLHTRDVMTNNETTNRLIGGLTVNVNLLRKDRAFLKLQLRGGIDYFTNETEAYFPEDLQFQRGNQNGFFSRGNNRVLNNNASAVLVFDTYFSDWHLRSQAGINRLDFSQERLTTQAINLVGGQANLEQAGSVSVFNRKLESEDVGYFFQQEANFDDKLILAAGIRVDQSSLNGDPDELFAYPKASVALNLANFDFLDNPDLSQLKLRAAYGEAGGVPNPDPVDLLLPSQTVFIGSNISGNTGSLISRIRGNPDIKPERSKEFETGADIGLFNNRIILEGTFYNKVVEDLILQAEVAESQGFEFQILNGGKLRNRGVELALNLNPVRSTRFNWNSRINWWRNRSEMLRLDIPAFTTGAFSSALGIFKIEEGKSLTQIVGPVPGSDGDVVLGDGEPDFQMSWYNDFTFFRNFQFYMLWHWKNGGDNIELTSLLSDFGQTSWDYDDDDDGNGVVNGDQRIAAFIGTPDASEFVTDASYFKLREIALYYNLPRDLLQGTFGDLVSAIRLGVSANNALIISDYKTYDPEVSNFGNDGVSSGVEVTPFPSSKRIFFHLNVGF